MKINKIKWRRHENGKYFGAFDTKEDAFDCLKTFANRYKYYTGHTITNLCQEYRDKGIMLYETQVGRWMKEVFNINIRNTQPRLVKKKTISFTIDEDLKDVVDNLVEYGGISHFKRSWYLNTLWRVHSGLPTEELVAIFPEGDEYPVSVLFYIEDEECRAIYLGEVPTPSKKLIENFCRDGEEHDLHYLKNRLELSGYTVLGGQENILP